MTNLGLFNVWVAALDEGFYSLLHFGHFSAKLWSETLAAKVLTLLQSFEKLEPAAVKVLDGDVSALQLESEYWVLNRSGGLFNPIIISIEETITEDGRLM